MEKDSVFTGIIIGMLTPVIGYFVVESIFALLTHFELMEYVSSSGSSKRQRTLALLGICCSLIPFHIAKRNYWNQTLRGIVFPTLIYVVAWIYYFKDVLFTF